MTDKPEPYGMELILDLHECNPAKCTEAVVRGFCQTLCSEIGMVAEDFHIWSDQHPPGPDENPKTWGVSAVQFIITSSIVIHTLPLLRAVYINVFSCKQLDTGVALKLARYTFEPCAHDQREVIRW